jgi:hypothetical protein
MKQIDITADDRLRVLAIRMLHADSGQWFLTTAIKRQKNAVNEIMRIGRMWKRICEYFVREDTGEPYAGFIQARLMSNDLVLASVTRRAIELLPKLVTVKQPPAPKESAAAVQPSPAPAAAVPDTSASKPRKGRSGTVTNIAQARTPKPKNA